MNTELILIRHGKTKWNEEERYIGQTDMPLSDNGVREVRAMTREGAYPEVDLLFTSPMIRCIQTAEIIYPHMKPVIIDEYREIDFGVLEGRRYSEMQDDPVFRAWVESGGKTEFPGYEDRDAYMDRVLKGYEKMCAYIDEYRHILRTGQTDRVIKAAVVCHGGTIMSIMARDDRDSYYSHMTGNGKAVRCSVDI